MPGRGDRGESGAAARASEDGNRNGDRCNRAIRSLSSSLMEADVGEEAGSWLLCSLWLPLLGLPSGLAAPVGVTEDISIWISSSDAMAKGIGSTALPLLCESAAGCSVSGEASVIAHSIAGSGECSTMLAAACAARRFESGEARGEDSTCNMVCSGSLSSLSSAAAGGWTPTAVASVLPASAATVAAALLSSPLL